MILGYVVCFSSSLSESSVPSLANLASSVVYQQLLVDRCCHYWLLPKTFGTACCLFCDEREVVSFENDVCVLLLRQYDRRTVSLGLVSVKYVSRLEFSLLIYFHCFLLATWQGLYVLTSPPPLIIKIGGHRGSETN